MHENVFIGVITVDETVAVSDVEPFNGAADAGFDDLLLGVLAGVGWGITFSLGMVVGSDFSSRFLFYFGHFIGDLFV